MDAPAPSSSLLPALGRAVLGLLGLIVVAHALDPRGAQDLVAFAAAEQVRAAGHLSAVYPAPDATSLFDVAPAFRAEASRWLPDAAITAFVAPPPALALGALAATGGLGTGIARLLLTLPALLGLLALHRASRGGPTATLLLLGVAPLLSYTAALGQSSGLLLAVVAVGVLPPEPRRDTLAGLVLGAITVLKGFPILLVAVALATGRRRLAAVALATVAAAVAGGMAVLPGALWADFLATAAALSRQVVGDWNNASLDALLVSVARGRPHPELVALAGPPALLALVVRVGLVGGAIAALIRADRPAPRWVAATVGMLALTPLLWQHYLLALVPALWWAREDAPTPRSEAVAVALTWALSASSALKALGVGGLGIHALAVGAWLATAGWLLVSRRRLAAPR